MRRLWLLGLVLLWGGCAAPPPAPPRAPQPPQYAAAAAPTGAFVDLEAKIQAAHGAEASGFVLLDSNADGLRWRLALIDSARHSIDLQYYTWFGDVTGRLLLKRVVDAADRGVKVRMLIDDLNTLLRDASTPQIRDGLVAAIDAHPNIQVRLFNPWTRRDLFGRAGEMVADLERLNQRMHNKQLVVDNRATIIGGRNIGDEYLGLNPAFNFRDLDVLGIGPVARQASAVFDTFWNSEWVLPVVALHVPLSEIESQPKRKQLIAELATEPTLAGWPIAPQSWSAEVAKLGPRLHAGTSRVVSDQPDDGVIRHTMLEHAREFADGAQRELLVENAYIIPAQPYIDWLRTLTQRGVQVGIVTNSLASHDVPAVNSHYKKWRKSLLEAGVSLYEIRHDAAVKRELADTAPVRAEFMGLHVKAIAVDGDRVLIGSMNLDPRSSDINSEMAVIVESKGLAADVAALIRRDMQPENSWRVEIDAQGRLRWANNVETVTQQPARNFWQRIEDIIFMAFPREYY
ncbi:MAG: phospholipase D family protein [Burkholderiaceae bacterium]|jgi:putative cardiolipin synthase|nr:phospholipase D family protein [Burkholderiaceae bacterium]